MALFSNSPQAGFEQVKDKLWYNNFVKAFGPPESQPAETFDLDPMLPSQGVSYDDQNIGLHHVAIPKGRIVGVLPRGLSAQGNPLLSMSDGSTIAPIGFAYEDAFLWLPNRANKPPRWRKAGYVELPYLAEVNDVYDVSNPLMEGDYVSAHFGSVTSRTVIAYEDRGKPVKWMEKAIYKQTGASSASVALTNANIPGIVPSVFLGFAGTSIVTGSITVAWSDAEGKWVATFGSAVTTVIYQVGHSVKMRAAQVLAIRQISATQEADGWLRWLEQDFSATPYGPLFYDYPTSTVTDEQPTLSDTNVFTLAHGSIAPHLTISVTIVTGSLISLDGTTTTNLASTDLGLRSGTVFENYAVGDYYTIDFVRGILHISENITNPDGTAISAANIRVSYKYASRYEYGRTRLSGYGVGMRGMTDGRNTGLPGTPAHLERAAADRRFVNTAGHFGAMRLLFS